MTGWYCFLWIRNENETYSGRKYTILFQERENEKGYIEGGEPELFILFEKIYTELEKPLEYPAPSKTSIFNSESSITFFDINSYGNFVRAFKDVYSAQKRALKQFKMVFGFALSSVVSENDVTVRLWDNGVEVTLNSPAMVSVYDLVGREIMGAYVNETHRFVLQKGVYVVCGKTVIVK
jgi:hypothetical protein